MTRSEPTAPAVPPLRHVILRVNIGEPHHQRISEAEARNLVDDPDLVCLSLEHDFDRQTATPRQWRAIARRLDQLLADARAACAGPRRYIIAGRAPLPVFTYLGASMVRMNSVFVANDSGSDGWQLYGPPETSADDGRDDFTIEPPTLGRSRAGRLALSVQCSKEYRDPDASIERILAAEGATLLGTYAIHDEKNSHRTAPLTAAELPVVLGHLEQGLQWIGEAAPDMPSLVVPLAGPNWVAFWLGHRLNPAVCGRFDLPNFVPGRGYVRALSFPMTKAPWLLGRPKLLFMNADPVDQMSATRGNEGFDAVQDALTRELDESAFEIRYRGMARIDEFMRDVERFQPDILHLHLHGSEQGDLAFENAQGKTDRFELERFVAMLRATGVRPALIVLNACFSAKLGPSLTVDIAECVVAMKNAVGIDAAIKFSRFLYEALGRGQNLATAIEQGKVGAALTIVEVYPLGDVAAEDITLMPRSLTAND